MNITEIRTAARIAALTFFNLKASGTIFNLSDLYDFCECNHDATAENGARWGVLQARHKGLIAHTANRAEYIIL